jgi:chromosome segregation ATPase
MQNKRESKSRLNSAAQHMLTNNVSLRENEPKRYDSFNKLEELQIEIQQKDITIAALQRNYDGISKIYKEEKGKSSEWVEKLAYFEKENSILKSKIQTFESQKHKAMQDLEKTQEELLKLLKGHEELRSVKNENNNLKVLLEKKKKECDEFINKTESYKLESESFRKSKIELESVIKKIRQDLDSINNEKYNLLKEFEEYKSNNLLLENKYAETLNQLDYFQSELDRKKSNDLNNEQQIAALKQQIAADRAELGLNRNKYSESCAIIQSLQDQLDLKNSKMSNSEKSMTDTIKDLHQQLNTSNSELKSLKNKLLELETRENFLKSELLSKSQDLENWKKEAKSLTENLDQVLSSSQKKSQQLEQEIKSESEIKKKIYEEKKHVEILLSLKEGEYKQYLEDKERSLSDCKNRIEFFAKSLENYQLENKKLRDDLGNMNLLYSSAHTSLQAALDDNKLLKDSTSVLSAQIKDLKAKLSEEEASKSKYKDINEEVSDQIKSYKKKIEDLTQDLGSLTSTNSLLTAQIENLIKENSDHSKSISDKLLELTNTNKEISNLAKKIESLETENKSLALSKTIAQTDLEKLQKLISSLNIEISGLKESLKKEKDNNNKFYIQISSKDLEISNIQQNLLIEKSNYKSAVEDNNNLVKRLQDIKEERDKLKLCEAEAEKKTKALKEREKSLSKGLDRLENGLNSLETNLSCYSCFNPLENAVLCIPCGHISCGTCAPKLQDPCKECEQTVKQKISISLFDGLNGKIVYKKQAIEDMKHILNQ